MSRNVRVVAVVAAVVAVGVVGAVAEVMEAVTVMEVALPRTRVALLLFVRQAQAVMVICSDWINGVPWN
jgi:hypothetical protein